MGVVRWFHPFNRTTRAENMNRETRAENTAGRLGEDGMTCDLRSDGFAENGDPMHLGEGPP